MRELSEFTNTYHDVVVIGGGATGAGVLRDLAMRGVKALLLEQRDLANGTSSRFHGLLHSGARYAVKDADAGRECIEENRILRRIGRHCVEQTEGFFVRSKQDPAEFEEKWVNACADCGISAIPVSVKEARSLEPDLAEDIVSVYRVPDSAVDGFRLVWQNMRSAVRHGADFRTYTEVLAIRSQNGHVVGVDVRDTRTGEKGFIACGFVVNAAGSWVGRIANTAGLRINVKPDRGTLIAFNHRFTSRVVNRLRQSSDGDIFVPHGSITILGTTSIKTDNPEDTMPNTREVLDLLDIGRVLFPNIDNYRILRVFCGTRPLYTADSSEGRGASRNFVVLDHEKEGLAGMATICGGKLTTYRLMGERMSDLICKKIGNTTPCRTAEEPLCVEPSPEVLERGRKVFPAGGLNLALSRLGDSFEPAVARMEAAPWKKLLLCECEQVTLGEFEQVASENTSCNLNDVRRRTRMGMGTCQGIFCGIRAAGISLEPGFLPGNTLPNTGTKTLMDTSTLADLQSERWKGVHAVLWGNELREAELARCLYGSTLNMQGN